MDLVESIMKNESQFSLPKVNQQKVKHQNLDLTGWGSSSVSFKKNPQPALPAKIATKTLFLNHQAEKFMTTPGHQEGSGIKNPFAIVHRTHTKKGQSSQSGESPAAVHELSIDTFGAAGPNNGSEYGQTVRSGVESNHNAS
jgi:hypothetical protein